jgi:hypothetical protein
MLPAKCVEGVIRTSTARWRQPYPVTHFVQKPVSEGDTQPRFMTNPSDDMAHLVDVTHLWPFMISRTFDYCSKSRKWWRRSSQDRHDVWAIPKWLKLAKVARFWKISPGFLSSPHHLGTLKFSSMFSSWRCIKHSLSKGFNGKSGSTFSLLAAQSADQGNIRRDSIGATDTSRRHGRPTQNLK